MSFNLFCSSLIAPSLDIAIVFFFSAAFFVKRARICVSHVFDLNTSQTRQKPCFLVPYLLGFW